MRAPRILGLPVAILVAAGLTLASIGPAAATLPGANGRIAFNDYLTGQIYAVNPDGTSLVQLTQVEGFAGNPAWSPDGEHIAFTGNMSGPFRLWIMDADGRHLRMVADDAPRVDDFNPTYTPNGRRLVFTRCRHDCALFSVRTNGTDRQALTPVPFDSADFFPSVSPDGKRIAFTRLNANGIIAQIYVMRADGSNTRALTPPALEAWKPDWSPDGRRITFSSNWPASQPFGINIYVMNSDGTGIHRLTAASYPNFGDFSSGYSPDGGSIVFASDRRYDDFCCSDLFVMTASGAAETRIRTRNVGVDNPAWGIAPPFPAAPRSPVIRAVSPAEAKSHRAAWCGALPEVLRELEGCA